MPPSLGDGPPETRGDYCGGMPGRDSAENGSPFLSYDRASWAALAASQPVTLSDEDLSRIRSTGDRLDLREVIEVYQPLAELLGLYVQATRTLHRSTREYLGDDTLVTPFVIGVAGSVAVGKSTTSRLLQQLLSMSPATPNVDLVATDGFLWPTAELERRGILHRKGFPESYDRKALLHFVSQVKSGIAPVEVPVYSHLLYDRIEGEHHVVDRPDILIIEGLNVLAPPEPQSALALSDLFDFSVYVDAQPADIARWYEERFLNLQQGAFADPRSYFHRYASLSESEARAEAKRIWAEVNEPNLRHNIYPTRPRASLILTKEADHRIQTVLMRKI